MMTYHKLLNEGRDRLYNAGQSDQLALMLLNELCSQKDINLYMDMDEHPDPWVETEYLEGIHRLEKGEPLGYVLGYESFYGYDFIVNEDVLIPRPETEELCGLVLEKIDEEYSDIPNPIVFDVACGSGAIGITLSLENRDLQVFASDISRKALETAFENNKKLGGQTSFLCGDLLEPFIERNMHCDILVCNPPYIPSVQEPDMEKSVVDFEPHLALFGGEDGLYFYKKVMRDAPKVLNPNGMLAFEIGWDQGKDLLDMAHHYFPEADSKIYQDMNGKDRMLVISTKKEG